MGSLDQRASKLLAVKVGVLKKKSAPSAIPAELCASVIGLGSNYSQSLKASNFAAFSKKRSKPLFSAARLLAC